jgi:DNA-3-methyladenine glycosylase II
LPVPALTEQTLARFAGSLAARDRDLARIIKQYGPPPLWARPATFSTLIKIILEQQVSLSSAAAIFGRLRKGVVPFRPERFIELGRERIAACGLTRQKTDYCLHLSEAIVTRQIRLARLKSMSDDDAKATLLRLKGIGSWSADVYLLMALLRPDVWPAGDLALAVAVRDLKDLKSTPTAAELFELAEQWRPFRSVAARMLWQFYLGQRGVKA